MQGQHENVSQDLIGSNISSKLHITSLLSRWNPDKSSERRADLAAIQTDDQFKQIRNGMEVIEKSIRGGSTVSALLNEVE